MEVEQVCMHSCSLAALVQKHCYDDGYKIFLSRYRVKQAHCSVCVVLKPSIYNRMPVIHVLLHREK